MRGNIIKKGFHVTFEKSPRIKFSFKIVPIREYENGVLLLLVNVIYLI